MSGRRTPRETNTPRVDVIGEVIVGRGMTPRLSEAFTGLTRPDDVSELENWLLVLGLVGTDCLEILIGEGFTSLFLLAR